MDHSKKRFVVVILMQIIIIVLAILSYSLQSKKIDLNSRKMDSIIFVNECRKDTISRLHNGYIELYDDKAEILIEFEEMKGK